MKTSIILFCFLSLCISTLAQSDSVSVSKNRIKYFNNVLVGGLFGESGQGTGFSISTTHGVRISRFAIGAGLGYDSYMDWKAVPFFGSVSFDFAKLRQNAFFLQFNAGYSYAERTNREEWLVNYTEYGSEMISSMLGYRINTNKFSVYIAAGHKFQKATFSYNIPLWSSFLPPSDISVEESMNRLVFQIGIGLH